jgi:hypothetical protein
MAQPPQPKAQPPKHILRVTQARPQAEPTLQSQGNVVFKSV